MKKRILASVIALLSLAPKAGWAQLSRTDRATIEAFHSAIKSAESGRAPIESALVALDSMRNALTQSPNGRSLLESLSEADFEELVRTSPGAIINREEVVFVEADTGFFTKLAAVRGDTADRAFFAALKRTYPQSVWPVYLEQQTDTTGCTRFGSSSLVAVYRMWADFQRNFPSRYTARAAKERDGVANVLTKSTCACGDAASVQRELQEFLRSFPNDPVRSIIQDRIDALRAGRANIRTNCSQ